MALKGGRGQGARPERIISATPKTTASGRKEIEEVVEYDAFVCGLCGKTAALHRFVNRHSSSRRPALKCDVGGRTQDLPGYEPGVVRWTRSVSVCDGCGEPIRGGRGGLYARSAEGASLIVHDTPDCRTKAGVA